MSHVWLPVECNLLRIFIRDPTIWTWIICSRHSIRSLLSVSRPMYGMRNTLPYQFSLGSSVEVDNVNWWTGGWVGESESSARVEDSVA